MPYYIISVTTCSHCRGAGLVQHPAWARYWKEYGERFPYGTNNALAELDFHDAFWQAEGYSLNDRLPPEEHDCRECDGTGEIRREVRLEEALAALGLQVEVFHG